jgi:hypothetical protein
VESLKNIGRIVLRRSGNCGGDGHSQIIARGFEYSL